MDTHKQVSAEILQGIRVAIEEDDPVALEKSLGDVGICQTPYSLVHDSNYDAGYILSGDDADNYLVFDVAFLDGKVTDGTGSGVAAGINSSSTQGLCTCSHFAAIKGSVACLTWILNQPDGKATLGVAHHSGKSLEELAEDPVVIQLLLAADQSAGASKSVNGIASRPRLMSDVAVVHIFCFY